MQIRRRGSRVIVRFAVELVTWSAIVAGAGPFVRIELPRDVQVSLPRNWVVLSKNQRITLDASTASRLDLSGRGGSEDSELSFAANLYDDAKRTIGIVNVRYYPQLSLGQDDARNATRAEVHELNETLRKENTAQLQKQGAPVTAWVGTTKTEIGGVAALVTEYRRRSLFGGEFRVRLVRVWANARSFTLTVSYSAGQDILLRPIADAIIASLTLRNASQTREEGSAAALVSLFSSGSRTILPVLLASFVLTWVVGLAPALLIRFVFVKRALEKANAACLAALFWLCHLILMSAITDRTSGHTALALVMIASYFVMRK